MDEQENQADSDNSDNTENDHDTGLFGGPALTLSNGAEGIASDDSGVDGRHFEV